jgi:hypothetical protein
MLPEVLMPHCCMLPEVLMPHCCMLPEVLMPHCCMLPEVLMPHCCMLPEVLMLDCCMLPEDPATGHLDTGLLGFLCLRAKWRVLLMQAALLTAIPKNQAKFLSKMQQLLFLQNYA